MKWTDEMTQTLRRMRSKGDSRANIALALGVTVKQVGDKVTAINDPYRSSELGRAWRMANPEKVREYNKNRCLARKAKEAGSIPRRTINNG